MLDAGAATPEIETAVGALFGVADAVRAVAASDALVGEQAELIADRLVEVAEQLADDEGVDPQQTLAVRRAFSTRFCTMLNMITAKG